MSLAYATLTEQRSAVIEALEHNPRVDAVLERIARGDLGDLYLGAGCVSQSVWNRLGGHPPDAHFKDIDVVFFDPEADDDAPRRIEDALRPLADGVPLDVKNQAHVHRWYADHFGYSIDPYTSLGEAIATWPTTSSAIAVRRLPVSPREYAIIAPFGLTDLLGRVVRPNKVQITREIYERKVERWRACWPELDILCW